MLSYDRQTKPGLVAVYARKVGWQNNRTSDSTQQCIPNAQSGQKKNLCNSNSNTCAKTF